MLPKRKNRRLKMLKKPVKLKLLKPIKKWKNKSNLKSKKNLPRWRNPPLRKLLRLRIK